MVPSDMNPQKEPEQPDIFSWILSAYNKGPQTRRDRWNLHGDAQLIVIAGSDSVAAALTHIFFHLAWEPTLVRRLQAEFDSLPSIEHDNLMTVGLLDAVINEVMRLHPPVPSGTQRVTPPEGMWIGEKFIPGNTIVQVPSYTVFRDERAFEFPNEFIPERWTTRPQLIKDKSVYIPFNIGGYPSVRYQNSIQLTLFQVPTHALASAWLCWSFDVWWLRYCGAMISPSPLGRRRRRSWTGSRTLLPRCPLHCI